MSNTQCHVCISNLIAREGIYSNDQQDRGKETVYGISRIQNPQWDGWQIVDRIPVQLREDTIKKEFNVRNALLIKAHEFYKQWWDSLRLDLFHKKIAAEIFDTSVNQGKKAAIICLQKSLKKITGKEIDIDGRLGPQTMTAMEEFMSVKNNYRNVESNAKVLIILLNYYQAANYIKITDEDPSQAKWLYGWILNRLDYTE